MQQLRNLPSPYYRVTSRAIILDERLRILVIENKNGSYELPGGGWEHGESFEECLRREIHEELGVNTLFVGQLWFAYRGKPKGRPWHLRLCAPVLLESTDFTMAEGMRRAYFVTKRVLMALPLSADEKPLLEHVDEIWLPKNNPAS